MLQALYMDELPILLFAGRQEIKKRIVAALICH